VVHTVESENQISFTQLQLRRAESAQRGFLLTLQPRFQTDFEEAASQLGPAITRLSQLVTDNPVQRRLLDQNGSTEQSANRRIPSKTSNLPGCGVWTPREIVREDIGPRRHESHLRSAGQMRAEEDRQFALRTADADRSQTLAASMTDRFGFRCRAGGHLDFSGAALPARA